ncbi:hypothetical protein QR98_0049690 [Sarcoptes scabiei]|uniref:Uncharacterized protein n=1 Tax=Sarcoptes scabiei TaxID=52283 RepID=A0A132A6B0_SARSC|nr:hypothetical protein QR98_0049690 [Sarcoptes scabiei]
MGARFRRSIISVASASSIALSGASITPASATERADEHGSSAPDSTVGSTVSPSITPTDAAATRSREDSVDNRDVAGGQQYIFSIDSPAAPHTRTFNLGLNDSASVKEIDGFFFITDHDRPVIRISQPWAKDRNGNNVRTWFTTDGTTLTQHVDKLDKASYPIIADPRWTWGKISGHVYFSKEETKKVAAGGAGASAVGPFWFAVPPPFGPAIAGWWEKNSLHVTETATRAVAGDKCVELKVGYIGVAGGAIVTVLYGLSTAGVAGAGVVDNVNDHPVRAGALIVVLAAVAVLVGWTGLGIRSSRPAVCLNRVMILGLTTLMVVASIITWPQIGALIEAGCVLVVFLLIPSLQDWLKKEPPRPNNTSA